jgi:hypothetical protein
LAARAAKLGSATRFKALSAGEKRLFAGARRTKMKNLHCLLIAIAICAMASSASPQSTAQKRDYFAHARCRITGADGNGR